MPPDNAATCLLYTSNDGRFMTSQGTPEAGTEGALQYLGSAAAQEQPFFMVVSLSLIHI